MSNFPEWLKNKTYTKKFTIDNPCKCDYPDILCWQDQRKRVFERDKHICRFCKKYIRRPVCHHTYYGHKKGSSEEFNVLITLCEKCHNNFHKDKKYNRKTKSHTR